MATSTRSNRSRLFYCHRETSRTSRSFLICTIIRQVRYVIYLLIPVTKYHRWLSLVLVLLIYFTLAFYTFWQRIYIYINNACTVHHVYLVLYFYYYFYVCALESHKIMLCYVIIGNAYGVNNESRHVCVYYGGGS